MIKLTTKQVEEYKKLHKQTMKELNEAINGTPVAYPGLIKNLEAPCLIARSISNVIRMMNLINKAEGKG